TWRRPAGSSTSRPPTSAKSARRSSNAKSKNTNAIAAATTTTIVRASNDRLPVPRSFTPLLFARPARRGELDLLDVRNELVGLRIDPPARSGDRLDRVAVIQFVVGVDLDLHVFVGRVRRVAENPQNFAVEPLERRIPAAQVATVELQRGERSEERRVGKESTSR